MVTLIIWILSFPFLFYTYHLKAVDPREYFHLLWFIDNLDKDHLLESFWNCRLTLVSLHFPHSNTVNLNPICPREYYFLLWFVDQLDKVHLLESISCCLSIVLFHFLVKLIIWMLFVLVNIIFFFDLLINWIRLIFLGSVWNCRLSLVSLHFPHGNTVNLNPICPREYYLLP